jgi:hypothetical protein
MLSAVGATIGVGVPLTFVAPLPACATSSPRVSITAPAVPMATVAASATTAIRVRWRRRRNTGSIAVITGDAVSTRGDG